MTYIIRSNSRLKLKENSVGNIHKFYAAQDYKAMLDFKNNIYLVDGVNKDISDVITTNGTREGSYQDLNGEYKKVPPKTPRLGGFISMGEGGVYLDFAYANALTSSDNGAAFTLTNSSERVYLSWAGTGTVSIDSLALHSELDFMGRKHVFYNRSGGISGTIQVVGDVSKVMVSNSNVITSYTDSPIREGSSVSINKALVSQYLNGKGTIVCRFASAPNTLGTFNYTINAMNENAPEGKLEATYQIATSSIGTAELYVYKDGGVFADRVRQVALIGSGSDISIVGLTYSGNGANTGLISYGQSNFGSSVTSGAVPPSAINDVVISAGNLVVMTHCVIFDRILTPEEAQKISFFGG